MRYSAYAETLIRGGKGYKSATKVFTMCNYQPVMNPSRTRNWQGFIVF